MSRKQNERQGKIVAPGRRSIALLCAVLLLAACSSPKPPSQFERDFEDPAKSWQELQGDLPPMPHDGDLVTFDVSGASQYRFAVDRYTLSIGSDGVYRYVLVATSPQGVRNVTYEGIRCETSEKKLYATGLSNGSWSKSRAATWTRIEETGNNRQQAALMKEYFCIDSYPTRSLREIMVRLDKHLPSTIW